MLLRHIIADDDTVGIQRILVAGRGQVVDLFDVAQLDPATRVKGKIQETSCPSKLSITSSCPDGSALLRAFQPRTLFRRPCYAPARDLQASGIYPPQQDYSR